MIRAAAEDDIQEILRIEREAITPPWTHGMLLSEIYNGDSIFILTSISAGSVTGFIILRRAADEAELLQIAVDKAARRRGIASMLMNAALDRARDAGVCAVYLEVRKSNSAAIGLYKKYGFTSAGTRKDYYASPVEDAVIMKLLLPAAQYGV